MTIDARDKYLCMMHMRYELVDHAGKARLLDEAAVITGLHREYLIGLLNRPGPLRRARRRQRGVVYGPAV